MTPPSPPSPGPLAGVRIVEFDAIGPVPLAAVAAILFLVAWNLVDRREFRYLLADKFERITLLATFIATLAIPLEWAILLGVAVGHVVGRIRRSRATAGHAE